MVLHHLQPSFTGGEISPSLQTRVDASSYNTWLKSAQNMFVHPQGGISNRAGTRYVGTAKQTNPCQLISFPISAEEGYVLELGANYMRFFTADGPVLDNNEEPLELVTPYAQEALSQIRVAQYNNVLYLAHKQYPLMMLTRTSLGRFTLAQAPLRYGPFMPANTDESKKMRIYPQTTTVTSQGVAATLAFAPVNYPNLMVWAYFNGNCFYVGENYGLHVADIADNFNAAYGSQGLSATAQGNILRISSAASNGGNWNGKTLVLEYRRSFTGNAEHTVTQTLSGGENAGTQIVAESGRYILESNSAVFTPEHVGGKFCLVHTVDANYQSGTLGYEAVSSVILSGSDWALRTSGNWTGTLTIEISYDAGTTWQTHKVLSRASGEDNFYLVGNLNDAENLIQIRVRSGQNSGEAGYELSAQSFIQRGIVNVISYISATQVVVEQERPCGSGTWTYVWAEGSFSPSAGYPACVFFYQDRLGLAATQAEAQTLWFSKTGNFMDFGRARDTLLSTDSLSIRLASTKLNAITAVAVLNKLLIFTVGSEWALSCNGALSLDTIELTQQSERGSYVTAPVLVGNRAVFVQARGGVLRDLVYDYATSSYTGDDLTLRAKHLFFNQTITQLAYAQEPDTLLWCTTAEGKLLSLTYVPEQGIYAWTHHQTEGSFVSICTLANQGQDELWLAVVRGERVFIERLTKRLTEKSAPGSVFLDSSISVRNFTASAQVSGLSHLEGKTVCALADGNVVENLTVCLGSITLPHAASLVHVGLPYESFLETLPVANATALERKQRYVSARVEVLDSRGGFVGIERNGETELVQRTNESYNAPISLQTGSYTVLLPTRHTQEPSVCIVQKDPLPLTILGVLVKVV